MRCMLLFVILSATAGIYLLVTNIGDKCSLDTYRGEWRVEKNPAMDMRLQPAS